MSETTVILRSLLLQAKKARSAKEMERNIMALCTGDDIAAVEAQYAEELKDLANEKE